MGLIIIVGFLITILSITVYYLVKYGFSKDTLKIIFDKIMYFRGFFFLIFWLYLCFTMMNMVNGVEKWAFLPFISCGIAGILSMYKKTREIGYKLFLISFIGGFGILIILGILSKH